MALQPRNGMLWAPFRKERRFIMYGNEKACSCFGHRDVEITEELKERAEKEIEKAIADGIKVFFFGGMSDFDDLVYDIVSEKLAERPDLGIKRIFCFPLEKQLRTPPRWFKRKKYEGYDCPLKEFDWWYTSLYYRNCAMINNSDLVLFYAEAKENSGAYKAYKFAVKSHKPVVNFALAEH